MTITIYRARKILTMNPARPVTTHIAVRDGIILGSGPLDELQGWGSHRIDDSFSEKVLMPGFVEGHVHLTEGMNWRYIYCGYHDRRDPDGTLWKGATSLEAVLERLRRIDLESGSHRPVIVGWSFDPIFFEGGMRCDRHDLDRVCRERPVVLLHASGHLIYANTMALERAEFMRPGIEHPGIALGSDGRPVGELKGPEAMTPVLMALGIDRYAGDAWSARAFSRLCVRAGVTTATDLVNPMNEQTLDMLLAVTAESDFPARIVPAIRSNGRPVDEVIDSAKCARAQSTDRLRLGAIKVVIDGSIQGFSARLKDPGYYNGAPQGLWYVAPEWLKRLYEQALANGLQVHSHTNGDQATELALDTLEDALRAQPAGDHRFVLQHCQLADQAQFRRMKALGMCANLFANHHFYWGDQHYALTVGPERATRMNACATAAREGVPFSIHSDAPVTPMAPLFTAWCAVNRMTSSGRRLGDAERIDTTHALHAITLGAAYTLGLDGEVGSLETGKKADFAVLEDDPLDVPAEALKDVPVWGTVLGGRHYPAADA